MHTHDDNDNDEMFIWCILHTHDGNDDNVTYFGGHNATFIDGLRPTLEAPSTSWSEWMPTGVHSSDTGIRDEMRWAYRYLGHHNNVLMDEWCLMMS
jgi:hypothetical protein